MTTMNRDHSQVIYPDARGIDLQPIMRQVYMWMGLGMLITAAAAFVTVNTQFIKLALNPVAIIVAVLAELGMVLGLSSGIQHFSASAAAAFFFVYAALNGFTLSLVLAALNTGTVTTAFLITAVLFGVMTAFAFTTSIDLTRMATYLMMGVIGLVMAMIVNMFINSGPLGMLISMIGVLIFTALTAYDTQRIGQMAASLKTEGGPVGKFGIVGALQLYLDFINLFLFVLRLPGSSRRQ